MSEDEFFAALERTPRDWYLVGEAIRRGTPDALQCPLSAAADLPISELWRAAVKFGFSLTEACRIVAATDRASWESVTTDQKEFIKLEGLRKHLLRACSLNEKLRMHEVWHNSTDEAAWYAPEDFEQEEES